MTQKPLDQLLGLLELEQIETRLFRAFHPPDRERRLYGGQIMAQAAMAAARTAPMDRRIHSLHGYFLRPGDPKVPALIDVEAIRDGKSFTTRRVVVVQRGRAIFTMDVSLQGASLQGASSQGASSQGVSSLGIEVGLEHQFSMPAGMHPPAEESIPAGFAERAFVTWRYNHKTLSRDEPHAPQQSIWFRANGTLPDDPLIHACLAIYESDNVLLSTARMPHKGRFKREAMQVASLDHALWFHRDLRVDQWLLYCLESPSASNARGYNRGQIYTADGRLVASTMQEGLIRPL